MNLLFNCGQYAYEMGFMSKETITREDAEKILLGSGWLAAQPAPFQQEVLRRSLLLHYAAGDYLYRMGDAAGGIYGLVSGNVAVTSGPAHETPRIIQLGRPGVWTGEGSYITRQPRLIELQAKVPSWMVHLPLDQMDKMTFQDPQIIRNFSAIMIHTVDVLLQMVNDLQLVNPARRIAATIDRASLQHSKTLPITQTELGEMACATRRQVSIALKDFGARRWTVTHYGSITVLDPEALRAFARAE